ncbi:MAG: hypothetical protein R3C15_13420 [Thermoleophilia bacterium]
MLPGSLVSRTATLLALGLVALLTLVELASAASVRVGAHARLHHARPIAIFTAGRGEENRVSADAFFLGRATIVVFKEQGASIPLRLGAGCSRVDPRGTRVSGRNVAFCRVPGTRPHGLVAAIDLGDLDDGAATFTSDRFGWAAVSGGPGYDVLTSGPASDALCTATWGRGTNPVNVIAATAERACAGSEGQRDGLSQNVAEGNGGADILLGGPVSDGLDGGPGVDYVFGNGDADVVLGGPGDDYLYGGEGDDYVDDNLVPLPVDSYGGSDSIDGGPGHDVGGYRSATSSVSIDGRLGGLLGDSDDFHGVEELWGGQGNDALHGIAGEADILFGGGGDDIVRLEGDASPAFHDSADCGDGNDIVVLDREVAGSNVQPDGQNACEDVRYDPPLDG